MNENQIKVCRIISAVACIAGLAVTLVSNWADGKVNEYDLNEKIKTAIEQHESKKHSM